MGCFRHALFAGLVLVAAARPVRAGVYTVDVYTGDIGYGFNAVSSNTGLFTSAAHSQHAQFTYTGALNFNDQLPSNNNATGDLNSLFFGANQAGISNYRAITTVANADYGSFATLASFLSASGSVSGYGYGSLYIISDATTATKGLNLTITHDDGASVYSGAGVLQPGTTAGPTSAITELVTLPAGTGYTIAYGRENGTPSELIVAVPEPVSLSLMAAGLIGLGVARRRRPR